MRKEFKENKEELAKLKMEQDSSSAQKQDGAKTRPAFDKKTRTSDGRPICFGCNQPGNLDRFCAESKKLKGQLGTAKIPNRQLQRFQLRWWQL